MDRIGISPGAYLKELTQEDNPRTGLRAMATFEGSQSECMAKKLELQAMGLSDLFVGPMGNGFWQVRAHFPYGFDGVVSDLTVLPSIHEMDAVVQQTSIYRSTKLRTLLGGGSTAATKIGKLMRIIEDFKSGQYAVGVTDHGVAKAEVDAAAVDATYGVPLLRSVAYLGVEECIEYYAVYKRTLTAATPTQVTASFEGVGQIWTADEVTEFFAAQPGFSHRIRGTRSRWLVRARIRHAVAQESAPGDCGCRPEDPSDLQLHGVPDRVVADV